MKKIVFFMLILNLFSLNTKIFAEEIEVSSTWTVINEEEKNTEETEEEKQEKEKITKIVESIFQKYDFEVLKKLKEDLSSEKFKERAENDKKFWYIVQIFNKRFDEKIIEIENQKWYKSILLWHSSKNKPIYAYYSWDLDKEFFWVFSNIHWGYEWETYQTANDMIEEFSKEWKTQWFIIPTINPDWLEIAENDNFSKAHYIEWRENGNKIELNRSFCTKDFKYTTYKKLKKEFFSDRFCMTQSETWAVQYALDNFKFSEIISLHSQMKMLIKPDNSEKDKRIKELEKKLKKVLPDYQTHYKNWKPININNDPKDKTKYTWLMENFIYEYKNIPTILIEFAKHGLKENRLLNLKNFLPNKE